MDDLDELWGVLGRVAETPRLLVACGFDGALAPDLGDPEGARAEAQASEALNVLLALADTTVAVVSRRDPEQTAELMFLSGAKGGLRHVAPEDVERLRDEVRASAVAWFGAGGEAPRGLRPGDLGVTVIDDGEDPDDVDPDAEYVVEGTENVAEVLEELAGQRRDVHWASRSA